MEKKLKTAVVGATGYAGFELVRLLARHPRLAEPALFTREESSASSLAELYPQVTGNGCHLPLRPFSWEHLKTAGAEVLFLATPHELSREAVPEAIARGLRVIDLSGAWRLQNAALRAVYKFEDKDPARAASVMQEAVYGLPELHRTRLNGAKLIANPGCYATSVILGLAPLVHAGLLNPAADIVCDSKSGVSGAGKAPSAKTHFVEVADNFSAYSVFAHRHTGEILEQLRLGEEQLVFTPHLLPIPRGILSTIYVRLREEATQESVEKTYREFYAQAPLVRVFAAALPQIRDSAHTNYCDIGFTLAPDGRRLVIVSCLDNLRKGAASQAVQNLNGMFGWGDKEGLD